MFSKMIQQNLTRQTFLTSKNHKFEPFLLSDQDGDAASGAEYSELPGLVEHNIEGYLAHSFRQGQNKVVETTQAGDIATASSTQRNDTVSGRSTFARNIGTYRHMFVCEKSMSIEVNCSLIILLQINKC